MDETDTSSLLHTSKLPNPQSPKRFFPNLLYKLAFFLVFLVFLALLPLSPSRTPGFVGETVSAGIWELLHLLVVGIAISYGLFSCCIVNTHAEKEPPQKSDGAHSIVSQILNVPLLFEDDEIDSHLGSLMESKCQTWSSLYDRNEPSLVVSNGSKESIALPSPIPWRSRSGKMEMEAKPKPGPGAGIYPTRSYSLPTTFNAAPSPAPPHPPPPEELGHGYPSIPEAKATSRSIKDELEWSRRERERKEIVADPLPSPSNPRKSIEGPSLGRPVTSVRPKEGQVMCFDPPQSPPMPKYPMKRSELMENAFTKSDNSDGYDECTECTVKEISSTAPEAVAEENEVDRKADEFIAKFREQIRQQRIESIKRSTKQRSSRQPH